MTKKINPATKVKAALKDLPFDKKVEVLVDVLRDIGLPMFASQLREALIHSRKNNAV